MLFRATKENLLKVVGCCTLVFLSCKACAMAHAADVTCSSTKRVRWCMVDSLTDAVVMGNPDKVLLFLREGPALTNARRKELLALAQSIYDDELIRVAPVELFQRMRQFKAVVIKHLLFYGADDLEKIARGLQDRRTTLSDDAKKICEESIREETITQAYVSAKICRSMQCAR